MKELLGKEVLVTKDEYSMLMELLEEKTEFRWRREEYKKPTDIVPAYYSNGGYVFVQFWSNMHLTYCDSKDEYGVFQLIPLQMVFDVINKKTGIPANGSVIECCGDPEIGVSNLAYSKGERTHNGNLKIGDTKHENDGYVNFTGITEYWRYPGENSWRR